MNNLGYSATPSNLCTIGGNRKRGFDTMVLGSLDDTDVQIIRNNQSVLNAGPDKIVCASTSFELKDCKRLDLGSERKLPETTSSYVTFGNVSAGLTRWPGTGRITGDNSTAKRHAWSESAIIKPDIFSRCEIIFDLTNQPAVGSKNIWCCLASHPLDVTSYPTPFKDYDSSGGKIMIALHARNQVSATTDPGMFGNYWMDGMLGQYTSSLEYTGTDMKYLKIIIANNILTAEVDKDDGNGYAPYNVVNTIPATLFMGNHDFYVGILDVDTRNSLIDVKITYSCTAPTVQDSSLRLCDSSASLYKQTVDFGPLHEIKIPKYYGQLMLEQPPFELHIRENDQALSTDKIPIPKIYSTVLIYTYTNAVCFNVKLPDLSVIDDDDYVPSVLIKNMGPGDSSAAQDIMVYVGNNATTGFDRKVPVASYNAYLSPLTEGCAFTFKADRANNSWFITSCSSGSAPPPP